MELCIIENKQVKGEEMNEFVKFLEKVTGDKREWRAMEARAKAMPSDYNMVYHEIMNYMFRFSAGGGMDLIAILKDLLELFEEGVANGKTVLEITGDDVAEFSDELLRNAKTYTENWHEKLNRDIARKLGK
jgi:DNA-binding ferritin-like protein (Dps family)